MAVQMVEQMAAWKVVKSAALMVELWVAMMVALKVSFEVGM